MAAEFQPAWAVSAPLRPLRGHLPREGGGREFSAKTNRAAVHPAQLPPCGGAVSRRLTEGGAYRRRLFSPRHRLRHPDAVHGGGHDSPRIARPHSPWGRPHGDPKGISSAGASELPPASRFWQSQNLVRRTAPPHFAGPRRGGLLSRHRLRHPDAVHGGAHDSSRVARPLAAGVRGPGGRTGRSRPGGCARGRRIGSPPR